LGEAWRVMTGSRQFPLLEIKMLVLGYTETSINDHFEKWFTFQEKEAKCSLDLKELQAEGISSLPASLMLGRLDYLMSLEITCNL
jgi:hypothetical protein